MEDKEISINGICGVLYPAIFEKMNATSPEHCSQLSQRNSRKTDSDVRKAFIAVGTAGVLGTAFLAFAESKEWITHEESSELMKFTVGATFIGAAPMVYDNFEDIFPSVIGKMV